MQDAEKAGLQRLLDQVHHALGNLDDSHQAALAENQRLAGELQNLGNRLSQERLQQAAAGLQMGDRTLADALLSSGENDLKDQARLAADMGFLRGEITEQEIRWHDALGHLEKAARLGDCIVHLAAQVRLLGLLGQSPEAVPLAKRLAMLTCDSFGKDSAEHGTCLNNLAALYDAKGRYHAAEPLFMQVVAIMTAALGGAHPDTKTLVASLAKLRRDQGD